MAKRDDGAVNALIVIDLGQGASIAAVIAKVSAVSQDLRAGAPAAVKASHVILAKD